MVAAAAADAWHPIEHNRHSNDDDEPPPIHETSAHLVRSNDRYLSREFVACRDGESNEPKLEQTAWNGETAAVQKSLPGTARNTLFGGYPNRQTYTNETK
mmetsp:Transcript_14583/g.16824  ORF Transcript_14583/g.16824 Transcript_14583/m.16824 type:complete len:100 (+) Transcript_14583:325-624(+)